MSEKTININNKIHKKLKELAFKQDTTIKKLVEKILTSYIQQHEQQKA